MRRSHRLFDFRTSIIDVLLNLFTSVIFISLITYAIMSTAKVTEEGMLRKAEYIATITWDNSIDCDVDLWARDPDGVIVSFSNKNQEMMNLERDDLGFYNDSFESMGNAISSIIKGEEPKKGTDQYNEEALVFRGIKPGKYILNVHLYSCRETKDKLTQPISPNTPYTLKVNLKLMKINPYKVVHTQDIEFRKIWEEVNLVEFTVDSYKDAVKFEKTPVKLVKVKTQ